MPGCESAVRSASATIPAIGPCTRKKPKRTQPKRTQCVDKKTAPQAEEVTAGERWGYVTSNGEADMMQLKKVFAAAAIVMAILTASTVVATQSQAGCPSYNPNCPNP